MSGRRASVSGACVAKRMVWASHREATREEDLAYSLLRLFDVNMPLLYGEGKTAFRRLQTEFFQSSTDESIFAWKLSNTVEPRGLFAPNAAAFTSDLYTQSYFARQHYEITNKRVRLTLSVAQSELVRALTSDWCAKILVPLNCGLARFEVQEAASNMCCAFVC